MTQADRRMASLLLLFKFKFNDRHDHLRETRARLPLGASESPTRALSACLAPCIRVPARFSGHQSLSPRGRRSRQYEQRHHRGARAQGRGPLARPGQHPAARAVVCTV